VDIVGCGSATVAALIQAGLLQSPADYYRLRRDDLLRVPGMGEKKADRLLAAIEHSKQAELWRFIYGLGINKVGPATAKQLALRCGDLENLRQMKAARLREMLGPTAAASIDAYLSGEQNQRDIQALVTAGIRPAATVPGTPGR
jgi:DNA ligase (NAD+)